MHNFRLAISRLFSVRVNIARLIESYSAWPSCVICTGSTFTHNWRVISTFGAMLVMFSRGWRSWSRSAGGCPAARTIYSATSTSCASWFSTWPRPTRLPLVDVSFLLALATTDAPPPPLAKDSRRPGSTSSDSTTIRFRCRRTPIPSRKCGCVPGKPSPCSPMSTAYVAAALQKIDPYIHGYFVASFVASFPIF